MAEPTVATPRTRKPWPARIAAAGGVVVLLALAAFVQQTTPSEAQWQSPMEVRGEIGDTLTGRNIEATVHGVQVVRNLADVEGWAGETNGIWVIADVTAEAVVTDFGASLSTALLRVGGLTFSATTRTDVSMEHELLDVGIPTRGTLAFEVPADILESPDARSAEIALSIGGDPRLDSMLVASFDLSVLEPRDEFTIEETVWGAE